MPDLNRFEHIEVTHRDEWRQWLADNHTQTESVWLVTFKKHCGGKYVEYESTVEEALCFGWVDSHTRRVDEDRTKLLFSPRRPGSPWAASNKRRVGKLVAEGKMTEAGMVKIDAAKEDGSWSVYDDIEAGIIPPDLATALKSHAEAETNWERMPFSSKKNILWWIKQAKLAATREKRIAETVAKAAEGKKANHPAGRDLI